MKRSDVKVPEKFKGGIAEEAYVDGYLAGLEDQETNVALAGIVGEVTSEVVQHGTERLLTTKGAKDVLNRAGKRLGKHARLANQIADVVDAVRKVGRK